MEKFSELSCKQFTDAAFSKEPVPGGGGTAALIGAIGTALAGMVANLTSGKEKYAEHESDIQAVIKEAKIIQDELLNMIQKDAENFYPLSQCYGSKAYTKEEKAEKAEKLQTCLKKAIEAPAEIIKLSHRALLLHRDLLKKGSRLAVSDVGCGAAALDAAIKSGWLNVLINLKFINDVKFIDEIKKELLPIVEQSSSLASEIYEDVKKQIST